MSNQNMGKWAEMAENIRRRDNSQLDDMNNYGGGMTIENRISLADARATDALLVLLEILTYLDSQEAKE